MLIAIDASRLTTTRQPTGVENYCQAVISGLLKQDAAGQIILYTPRPIPSLPHSRQKILSWPFSKLWSQLRLAWELLIHPPDVFFSPAYVIPFLALLNRKTKKVVTIHDVAFIHLPASYSFWQRYFLTLTTRQAVKHADKIIVPTQTTKNDLIKYFNCPAEKVKVIYLGYYNTPANQHSAHPKPAGKLKRQKQVLYLGRLEDKKNILQLIQAFALFHQKHPDYKLILAGKPGVGFKKIKPLIDQHTFIDYRGYINEATKNHLLQSSLALVLLSKYEGFGLPVLEAFANQLPVLASDIPVLREVAGQACLFAQPDDSFDIAKKLESIIINKELRQQLIDSGLQRLRLFDWQVCARQTWKILNN